MLHYPKIPGSKNCPDGRCVAFEKYDGTNLHWTWERRADAGDPADAPNSLVGEPAASTPGTWMAFGTRRDHFPVMPDGVTAFTAAHPELAGVQDLFVATAAAPLAVLIARHHPSAARVTCFAEYVGPRSFAGMHTAGDAMDLVLFDVEVDGAMVDPDAFVRTFAADAEATTLKVARVVYQGKLTGRFVEDVQAGKYKVAEGVVCKGVKTPWMAKIKTNAHMERLKAFDPKGWEQYWE